jgi:hypothetical protein
MQALYRHPKISKDVDLFGSISNSLTMLIYALHEKSGVLPSCLRRWSHNNTSEGKKKTLESSN